MSTDNHIPAPDPSPNPRSVPVDTPSMTAVPIPASPPAPPPSPAAPAPLTPDQVRQFQSAVARGKKVRRAAAVALADGYFTAIGAATTFLFCAFSFDLSALLLGLVLLVLSFNSFRGARRLKRFDLSAPPLLALNQLALAAAIVLYCAVSYWQFSHGHSDLAKELSDPQLASAGVDMKSLIWDIMLALYGGVAGASIIAQGLTALYYITRKQVITDYLAQTPPWVISIQKAQAGA
jgi:hypothetical protein